MSIKNINEKLLELEGERAKLKTQIEILNNDPYQAIKIIPIPIPEEKPKSFHCNWCGELFEGDKARFNIKEHITNCPKDPNGNYKPPIKQDEKLFTCQLCGVKLTRYKMKEHAITCSGRQKRIKELESRISSLQNEDIKELDEWEVKRNEEVIENLKNDLDIELRSIQTNNV